MLTAIKRELEREKSFEKIKITLTSDLAGLAKVFEAGGAEVSIAEANTMEAGESPSLSRGVNITINNRKAKLTINAEKCRFFADKCYGIGQTVWTAVSNVTGLMLAGKTVVIAGYGKRGNDMAGIARAFGASVIITEINPVRAVEAIMDGFDVAEMNEAARYGDIFAVAADGEKVISEQDYMVMRDGAFICNAGNSGEEIDMRYLEAAYIEKENKREHITEYELMNGRCINVIAEGRNVSAVLKQNEDMLKQGGSISVLSEMEKLDYAVLVLAAKKLVSMLIDDSADYFRVAGKDTANAESEENDEKLSERIINAAIEEAREETAKRKLRILGRRI